MKPPKKSFKEPSLPTQDEARRANVLREEMLSQFRILGESLSAVREDVGVIKLDLHTVKEDVAVLKVVARSHTDVIRDLNEGVQGNTQAIQELKSTVNGHTQAIQSNTEAICEMRTDIKSINHRLEVVEAKP